MSNINPVISIIIPVYNSENFIGCCLQSIIDQTFYDFEVILIDDCSTDKSAEICSLFISKDLRFRLIKQKFNRGPGICRNLGLQRAKGQFITFVDSDDYILPFYLEKLLRAIKLTKSDIALGYAKGYKNLSMVEKSNISHINYIKKSQREIICGLFSTPEYMSVWCKLYKKETIKDIQFLPIKNAEDVDFNSRVYLKTDNFVLVPEFLYFWRETPNSITRSPFSTTNIDALNCFFNAWTNMPDEGWYQSLALLRLYKVILYTRYNSPKELKSYANKKIRDIKSATIGKFIKNRSISIDKKIGILIFLYFPFIYSIFRFWRKMLIRRYKV